MSITNPAASYSYPRLLLDSSFKTNCVLSTHQYTLSKAWKCLLTKIDRCMYYLYDIALRSNIFNASFFVHARFITIPTGRISFFSTQTAVLSVLQLPFLPLQPCPFHTLFAHNPHSLSLVFNERRMWSSQIGSQYDALVVLWLIAIIQLN